MIKIDIPGYDNLHINHVVFDFNGTIAVSGKVIDGVKDILNELSKKVNVHIFTADTFGNAKKELDDVSCRVSIISKEHEDYEKLVYLKQLGPECVIAIGNGMNDKLLLDKAAIGIGVIGDEGAALKNLLAADIIVTNIFDALNLVLNTEKIKATLRK